MTDLSNKLESLCTALIEEGGGSQFGGAHYALGYIRSILACAEYDLQLTKKQMKRLHEIVDGHAAGIAERKKKAA